MLKSFHAPEGDWNILFNLPDSRCSSTVFTVLYLRNQIGKLGLGLPELPGWTRDDGTGSYTGVETEWDCVMRARVSPR